MTTIKTIEGKDIKLYTSTRNKLSWRAILIPIISFILAYAMVYAGGGVGASGKINGVLISVDMSLEAIAALTAALSFLGFMLSIPTKFSFDVIPTFELYGNGANWIFIDKTGIESQDTAAICKAVQTIEQQMLEAIRKERADESERQYIVEKCKK